MSELPEISVEELSERVFYSVSKAGARLARICEMPLKEARGWFELAYYDVVSQEGFSQSEAADLLGVSTRKVVQLARELKDNFYRPEQEGGLPRRIEFMLWAGPLSEGRIRQSLSEHDDEAIEEALDQLVEEGRVERDDGRTTYYEVPRSEFRLYQDDWIARIDGLNDHLANVVDGVYARFFEESDDAFARTVTFRCREEDVEELREVYEEVIFPKLHDMEERLERAREEDRETDPVQMRLSLNWAPHRLYEQVVGIDEEER